MAHITTEELARRQTEVTVQCLLRPLLPAGDFTRSVHVGLTCFWYAIRVNY